MDVAGIELRYLVSKIGSETAGHYVSNIYGVDRSSLLFKLHHTEKPDAYLMVSTSGLWLTSRRLDQSEPNRLQRRLRDALGRARLTAARQEGAERIAYLHFSSFDKEYVLAAELFGGGNLVLCDGQMKILALLHSIEVRHRKLAVGLEYAPPPANGIDVLAASPGEFAKTVSATEAVRWAGRTLGLPKRYAEEVFRRAGEDPRAPADGLSGEQVRAVFEAARSLASDIAEGRHEPCVSEAGAHPVMLPGAKPAPSFMEAVDEAMCSRLTEAGRDAQSQDTEKKIREYRSRLEEQEKAAETVVARSGQISELARALSELASAGAQSLSDPRAGARLEELGAKLIRVRGVPHLSVSGVKAKINPDASLHAAASALFDESKKQASAVKAIEAQRLRSRDRLAELESRAGAEREQLGSRRIAKRAWFQRYRWFFTSDGFVAVGGRDSSSNSALIRKQMKPQDRVFHADTFGSPFFVLKDAGKAGAMSIEETADATVCFSRAWRDAAHGSGAYWVSPGQVKRAAPSGQFLPKGSFVIEGQRNYVRASPLRLAVGVLERSGSLVLACGPPVPVRKHSLCYAVIEPSSGDMAEAAKKIRAEFLRSHEEQARAVPLDEFVRALPAGGSHVVELGDGSGQPLPEDAGNP